MKSMHVLAATFAANLAILAGPVSARGSCVLETATYTGVHTGETDRPGRAILGAAFTLGATEEIESIGGQFGGFPS